MSNENNSSSGDLVVAQPAATGQAMAVFNSSQSFEMAQRIGKALSSSDLVPESYRGNLPNCLIALEVSQRVGASPIMVMQNLHVIQGRPSWSSSFIIAALNSCGRFSPLRFKVEDLGERSVSYEYWDGPKGQRSKKTGSLTIRDKSCTSWAYDKATGEVLEGPAVTIEMAVLEGWYTKPDSKWKTMADLMLRYRAAAFFGRLYAPDVLMGMHTAEEVADFIDVTPTRVDARRASASPEVADLNAAIAGVPSAPANDNAPVTNDNAPPQQAAGSSDTEQIEQIF